MSNSILNSGGHAAMTKQIFQAMILVAVGAVGLAVEAAEATGQEPGITRIWLSHQSPDPNKLVVSWETKEPGNSIVRCFGDGNAVTQTKSQAESVTLHHVEIDAPQRGGDISYEVRTGKLQSARHALRAYPQEGPLRVAIVADWQGQPKLDALLAAQPHLLLTAGDNISSLHERCGVGVKDCTRPYGELIEAYPELFSSVRFMPALGNHDREIRPRGPKPPPEPVYDVDATAFRQFFALPDDEWKWHFDLPEYGVRLVALDLNHIQDQGTTWRTCHPFNRESEQFRWFDQLLSEGKQQPWTVTLHNERSGTMRGQEKSVWHSLFKRGTLAVTGFGYFAERAEVDGFTYYNTALGVGAKYPDAKSQFFASTASFLLLTIGKQELTAELMSLEGKTLDAKRFTRPSP